MPKCGLKHCPYDKDGRCVENQLPNCPNLVADGSSSPTGESELAAESEGPTPPPTHEPVYSGNKLTSEEAASILQMNPQVVVLGGMVESGKTTLLARIFEMFQSGIIANFRFMGTRTAVEFEKLSWHATIESGGSEPTTEHTYRSENNTFLHLRLRESSNGARPINLLIGDIPGEVFPEAISEESVCLDLYALRRANHVVLFLDSKVLKDTAKRHDHCGKIFDFVGRALQTGQVGQHTVLHLIIAKCDLIQIDTTESLNKFISETERSFRTRFASRVGGLHSWRVAARPEQPIEPTFDEINRVFHSWTIRANPHADVFIKPPPRCGFHRDFSGFGLTS